MGIDRANVIELLKHAKHTQGEIAQLAGCSVESVVRISGEEGLRWGRGIRHKWMFDKWTPALGYLAGIYLTDGYIPLDYYNRKPRGLVVVNTTSEIVDQAARAMRLEGIEPTIKEHPTDGTKGNRRKWHCNGYSTLFATWLRSECQSKQQCPDLLNAPLKVRLYFLAGIIDGDGHVDKWGSIRVRATGEWMKSLPDVIRASNIRTTGLKTARMLENGKPYWSVTIRRSDFRSSGGECYHPIKQSRILYAHRVRS